MSQSDLVVFSHLRWSFVWQRPQHLMSRFAKARRTWFVEEPLPSRDVDAPILRSTEEGAVTRVWLEVPSDEEHLNFGSPGTDAYVPALRDLFGDAKEPWVWLYTALAWDLAKELEPGLLVYDVMDDLAAFKFASEAMVLRQHQAIAAADVVFAGGRSLFEKVEKHRTEGAYLFPSGVEPEHYATARSHRRSNDRRVAGYVGVIDERLDLELIDELATRLPDWDIHMVGPALKVDEDVLPRRRNIVYFGQQPYDRLPELMGGFDVALMPFALNESTRSISPTKTLEYLAAGLPVVSTRIPDVVADYSGVVDLQDTASGFASACRRVYDHGVAERDAKVRPLLRLHHWNSIAQRMEDLVLEAAERKAPPTTRARRGSMFDYVIVGAGFAGSTLAERLANDAGKKVLVVDKRPHIGGNAYDHYDDHGILVHKYGPHIFHTNSGDVFEYLSRFTKWRQYEHRVLARVEGRLVPIPINLDTINELYGLNLTSLEMEMFLEARAEPIEHCKTSEDVVVSKVGRDLYEKFFRNYTRKQWGLDPSELDASVTARVPTRTNRDPRYFTDHFQAMPSNGYTRMFENMLDHADIKIMLNTDYAEIRDLFPQAILVYTGPVDEFFGFRYGKLPYRSLRFEFETLDEPLAQPAPVVNFPNDHPYTRVTEFKYLTGQEHRKTTIVREFPTDDGDPYYPVPRPENAALYKRYKALADVTEGVHFVGRLATYKYYNMDQVTAQALQTYAKIMKADRTRASTVRTIRLDDPATAASVRPG